MSNKNLVASRHIKREKVSLLVDACSSKIPWLKPPTDFNRQHPVINNTVPCSKLSGALATSRQSSQEPCFTLNKASASWFRASSEGSSACAMQMTSDTSSKYTSLSNSSHFSGINSSETST